MGYKLWAGLARTEGEYLAVKDKWIARSRDTLDEALWDAMKINDQGKEVAWEIEGDDGKLFDRREIVDLVRRNRTKLAANPPQKY